MFPEYRRRWGAYLDLIGELWGFASERNLNNVGTQSSPSRLSKLIAHIAMFAAHNDFNNLVFLLTFLPVLLCNIITNAS